MYVDLNLNFQENMLEIGQSNYVRAIGGRGQILKPWKDKRYINFLVLYGFHVYALPYFGYAYFGCLLTHLAEPYTKETKAFKEECIT